MTRNIEKSERCTYHSNGKTNITTNGEDERESEKHTFGMVWVKRFAELCRVQFVQLGSMIRLVVTNTTNGLEIYEHKGVLT